MIIGNSEVRRVIKNKGELLEALEKEYRVSGSVTALALAYLLNEICPDDRITRQVFERSKEKR